MPEMRTIFYELTGWTTVEIVAETEMAVALGVTVDRLHELMPKGIGLVMHAHPLSTGGEHLFLPFQLALNQAVYECWSEGGHKFQSGKFLDAWSTRRVARCSGCGTERYE